MKRRLSVALLAVMATILIPAASPTYALGTPMTFICQMIADGVATSYDTLLNPGCSGHTLIDSNHETLVVDIMGACSSTTLNYDYVRMAFNGDFSQDYTWTSFEEDNITVVGINQSHILLGDIPCQKSDNPAVGSASGGFYIRIPMAGLVIWDKQAYTQDTAYYNNTVRSGAFAKIIGSSWSRPTTGAVNRLYFALFSGAKFTAGTHINIYAE